MRTTKPLLLIAGLLVGGLAQAAQPDNLEQIPEAAPAPLGPMEDGKAIEPEITIVQRKDATVQEYRAGGRIYMVKVKPFIGPAYYLVDNDGDGRLETRVGNWNESPVVPQWVIFSW
jgi:hypothetical protein